MATLTIGKLRGLQQIATPDGRLAILALDHRGSLAKLLGISEEAPGFYATVRDFKLMVLENLLDHATAALLDPQYIAADAVAGGTLPGNKGLIITIEKSGYSGSPTARYAQVLPGWSVAKSKRMGASAIKLLVDYNPQAGEMAEQQECLVAQVIEEARAADLTLLLEAVTYSIDPAMPKGSAGYAAERPALVAETARRLGAFGPDVLKIEFPHDAGFVQDEAAWADACAAVNEASPVPWAVLSAGVDYATFKRQVKVACQAGACGYVAGRSFWQDVTRRKTRAEQVAFLRDVAAPRMDEVVEIARACGRPWTERYPDAAQAGGEGWYRDYAG